MTYTVSSGTLNSSIPYHYFKIQQNSFHQNVREIQEIKKCMQFYYIIHHILMFFAQALGIKITVNLSSNVQSFM